jgi:predicted dehydrogenase
MSLRLGICGTGAFADNFIPLFQAHPLVEQVVLADLDGDKLAAKAARFGVRDTAPSLDALCAMDLEAIALFTQHHLHGPHAVQALRSGKHVYSAVPPAATLDEMGELVRAVEKTGQIYMLGETSYYYPCTLYCRERYQRGDFGHVVYAEAEYYHDYSHGLVEVMRWRHGPDWKRYANWPPMFYPTHSVSMVVSVTGAHATHVSCMGFVDRDPDQLYCQPDPIYENTFSNESMLCRMSDGSMARYNEFRRIGHPGTVGMSMYGTEGSFEQHTGSQVWVTKDRGATEDLTALLAPTGQSARVGGLMDQVTGADGTHHGASTVHAVERLPTEFVGLPNGHNGSHQFLVHDFVGACVEGALPPNNVWQAARYLAPGLVAHASALQGGVLLPVPDYGDPPTN